MATVYSDQETLAQALAAGTGYSLVDGQNVFGKVVCKTATYTTTAVASGTVIQLFKLPKGARLLRGNIAASASLAGSSTLSIGTDVSLKAEDLTTALTTAGVANLMAATATTAAFNLPFAATRLLGFAGLTSAVTTVNAVTGGATLTAGVVVVATIEYLQN